MRKTDEVKEMALRLDRKAFSVLPSEIKLCLALLFRYNRAKKKPGTGLQHVWWGVRTKKWNNPKDNEANQVRAFLETLEKTDGALYETLTVNWKGEVRHYLKDPMDRILLTYRPTVWFVDDVLD